MKVVIHPGYGAIRLPHEACVRARELGVPVTLAGEHYSDSSGPARESNVAHDVDRTHPGLVQVVEEGLAPRLKVVEIPFDSPEGWHIEDYDGAEWIAEDHRTWS